jgi:hypothetical protein
MKKHPALPLLSHSSHGTPHTPGCLWLSSHHALATAANILRRKSLITGAGADTTACTGAEALWRNCILPNDYNTSLRMARRTHLSRDYDTRCFYQSSESPAHQGRDGRDM